MRVLVIGASGFVGQAVVRGLTAAGMTVLPAGRSPDRLRRLFPALPPVSCDFATDTEADWQTRLRGVEAVVNLAGLIRDGGGGFKRVHADGPQALFRACRAVGVTRVVQVSALGADEAAVTQYHVSKRAADDALAQDSGTLDWIILRPSLILGPGGASHDLFAALAALPLPPRLGPGTWQVQPIGIADFVATVHNALQHPGRLACRLNIVGPEAMTTDALTATYRSWLGLPPVPSLPIPQAALRLAGTLGDRLALGALTSESLTMLAAGNTAPVEPLVETLGVRPRALAEALAETPATAADRWRARLRFFPVPLRLSLAFVWLWTAFVSAGVYPLAGSLQLIAPLGLPPWAGLTLILGGAGLDLILGVLLLIGWRIPWVGAAQLLLMAGYTGLVTLFLPDLWLHPLGPISKNLPVAAATLVMMALETDRG